VRQSSHTPDSTGGHYQRSSPDDMARAMIPQITTKTQRTIKEAVKIRGCSVRLSMLKRFIISPDFPPRQVKKASRKAAKMKPGIRMSIFWSSC